ncbi:hypothetical protein FRX31_020054, partial [Thalictrum thalictroides]
QLIYPLSISQGSKVPLPESSHVSVAYMGRPSFMILIFLHKVGLLSPSCKKNLATAEFAMAEIPAIHLLRQTNDNPLMQ